ncbi:universal stress protein [Haladaptatus sp. NG-SE-30]
MNASPALWTPSLLYTGGGSRTDRRNVVVPLSEREADDRVFELAASIADYRDGDVILVTPVIRPTGASTDHAADLLAEHEAAAEHVLRTSLDPSTNVRTIGTTRGGRTFSSIVRGTCEEYSADVIVLDEGKQLPSLRRNVSTRIAKQADCDIATIGGNHASSTISSILVPIAGGPHSGLAVDAARRIAEVRDAWIELLHVVEEGAGDHERAAAEKYAAAARDRLDKFDDVDEWVLEADDPAAAIVEQSRYYDVTVMGAPQKNRLREFVFGSTTGEVRSEAYNTVVTVERPHERDSLLGRWL